MQIINWFVLIFLVVISSGCKYSYPVDTRAAIDTIAVDPGRYADGNLYAFTGEVYNPRITTLYDLKAIKFTLFVQDFRTAVETYDPVSYLDVVYITNDIIVTEGQDVSVLGRIIQPGLFDAHPRLAGISIANHSTGYTYWQRYAREEKLKWEEGIIPRSLDFSETPELDEEFLTKVHELF